MTRLPRCETLPAGVGIFHVGNRGNNKMKVFLDDHDRNFFVALVAAAKTKFDIEILNWAMLWNHYHLLLRILDSFNLSAAMRLIDFGYALYFNKKYGRSGHIWQGRFDSVLVDTDEYLLTCAVYVDLNPWRAGLCEAPEDWAWSSAGHHLLGCSDKLTTPGANQVIMSLANTAIERHKEYRKILVGEMLVPIFK